MPAGKRRHAIVTGCFPRPCRRLSALRSARPRVALRCMRHFLLPVCAEHPFRFVLFVADQVPALAAAQLVENARGVEARVAALFGDDEVVEHFDADQLSHLYHPAGEGLVGLRGGDIAARVIMHEHDPQRQTVQGRTEDIRRVGRNAVLAAEPDELEVQQPVLVVESHHPEMFLAAAETVFAQEHAAHERGDGLGAAV